MLIVQSLFWRGKAMSVSKIQAQFGNLEQLANSFYAETVETAGLYQRIRQHVEDLRADGWTGQGAEAFYAEMDEILPALKRLCDAFEEASNVIKKISTQFQDAELNVINAFKTGVDKPLGLVGNNVPVSALNNLMPRQLKPLSMTADTFLFGSNQAAFYIQDHINKLNPTTLDSSIEQLQTKLDSLSDLTGLEQMRLQQTMERHSKAVEMLSNLMHKMSDITDIIVASAK
jgi:WXG100 family type VII secretion target